MRKVILFAALVLLFNACGADNPAPQKKDATTSTQSVDELKWFTNLDKAREAANQDGKPVFVFFTGSDWCGWCKKLVEEVLSTPEFTGYAKDNLIMCKLDFPRKISQTEEEKKYNRQIAEQFGIEGFPTVVLVDGQGKEIARTGYRQGGGQAYVDYLKQLLKPSK